MANNLEHDMQWAWEVLETADTTGPMTLEQLEAMEALEASGIL